MSAGELGTLLGEACALGIVASEKEAGLALWEGAPDEAAVDRSVRTLARLARSNASFALAAHRASLAEWLVARLQLPRPGGRGVAAVQGRFGLGRLTLARYVAGAPLDADDRAMLADHYGGEERLLTGDDGFDWLVAPAVDGVGTVQWALHPRDALSLRRLPQPHGFDELATLAFRAGAGSIIPALTTALDAAASAVRLGEALALEALALVAIGLGAAERGHGLARAYASTRRQGGQAIERHPAVQLLLASSRNAITTVQAQLESVARAPVGGAGLRRILSVRAEAHPLLCRAANDALQVFGGGGYMRDTGAEKVVRDENHLRLSGGSPPELSLFVAESERLGG